MKVVRFRHTARRRLLQHALKLQLRACEDGDLCALLGTEKRERLRPQERLVRVEPRAGCVRLHFGAVRLAEHLADAAPAAGDDDALAIEGQRRSAV